MNRTNHSRGLQPTSASVATPSPLKHASSTHRSSGASAPRQTLFALPWPGLALATNRCEIEGGENDSEE